MERFWMKEKEEKTKERKRKIGSKTSEVERFLTIE
jgi:hypothetical protein